MLRKYFRYPDGVMPNVLALAYTLAGYPIGIMLLLNPSGWANGIGTLLLAHVLVYSAYFIHEFAHNTIFKTSIANTHWGTLMSWLNGSCYAPFADLRRKHMRHHVDRADVITFDSKQFLHASPAWFRKLILTLEWAYIPAVEIIMHVYVMAIPFLAPERKQARLRIITIFLLRATAFAALGAISPKALALYFSAYVLFLTVLRFADAYQHTYDAFAMLGADRIPNDKLRDRAYEQSNTYSNLVSVKYPWLNLLLLNFPYHNAHHEKPAVPWHRLPALHRELFGESYEQIIPMSLLLAGFHTYRVKRVLSEDYGVVTTGTDKAAAFYGAVGVSFLTAV